MKRINTLNIFTIACLASLLVDPHSAFAGSNGIEELSTGVDSLADTFTGTIARSVSVIALAIAAISWAMAGEWGGMGNKGSAIFFAIGALAAAPSVIESVFDFSGAAIQEGPASSYTLPNVSTLPSVALIGPAAKAQD